jgi:hypothetical protein
LGFFYIAVLHTLHTILCTLSENMKCISNHCETEQERVPPNFGSDFVLSLFRITPRPILWTIAVLVRDNMQIDI